MNDHMYIWVYMDLGTLHYEENAHMYMDIGTLHEEC